MRRELEDDERTQIRRALHQTRIAPRSVCERALDACRLVPRQPSFAEIRGVRTGIAYAALRTRARGITLGDTIYLRSDCLNADNRPPLWLLAHEIAHVVQFRRDGTLPFLYRYVREYFRGIADGLGDKEAYRSISYEVEARRVERALGPDSQSADTVRS